MVGDIISRHYYTFRVLYVVYHVGYTKVYSDQYKIKLVSDPTFDTKYINKYIWEW